MIEIIENEKILKLKKNLSKCVNVHCKTFYNKELILSFSPIKKQIGFILYGQATIVKTDIHGNTSIMRDLKENDIFSNLFFRGTDDEIYIISNKETEVAFIDYYSILKNCGKNCPFHDSLVLSLFDLLIEDNRQQNEKIILLSKRTVREKIECFLSKRMNEEHIFKVTTSYKAIAEYLFVDRSNLMRELTKMEEEHLIQRDGRIIKILFLSYSSNKKN